MFARFRNLFSKTKNETTPEPEPERATAEDGVIDQTKLENNLASDKELDSAKPEIVALKNDFENNFKCSAEHAAKVTYGGQSSGLVVNVEPTQIVQPNVHPSNENTVHELSTTILESMPTATESTLDTSLNKNKTVESINMSENENKEESDSTSHSEEIGTTTGDVQVNAADYGNGVSVLVKVDKAGIEVNSQSSEVIGKQNEAAHAIDESESNAVGESNSANEKTVNAQTNTELVQLTTNLASLIAANDSINAETPTEISETSIYHSIETTSHQNPIDVNENLQIASSIAVDELATDTSSPATDTYTQSSSPDGTTASDSTTESSTIVIKPTGDNEIACTAISNKLQEIAEVAESLDASIRDVQQDAEALEVNSTSTAEKKREAMRSNSSEDWHSRSTEDDSFVTASEGNFTPHSHSSSYQTASGRTSSYISSGKNSFDVSEADDSTFASAYEIPADINMSFDGSEQSFVSAQQQESTPSPQQQQQQQQDSHSPQHNTALQSDSGAYALPPTAGEDVSDGDGSSIADIEELHSQSVTPTPGDGDVEQYNFQSIPVESESDLDSSCIVDAPSIEMLTEVLPITSVTPEVSTCSSAEQQQAQNYNNTNTTTTTTTNSNDSNNANSQKPNAAWRRSKYYENITKQTIKGFL